MAIVGGVSQILSPRFGINFSQAHMLAPDGRCKTFDEAADGFVRSEGCGVVILRRLPDAQAQRDSIYAVVRGTAVSPLSARSVARNTPLSLDILSVRFQLMPQLTRRTAVRPLSALHDGPGAGRAAAAANVRSCVLRPLVCCTAVRRLSALRRHSNTDHEPGSRPSEANNCLVPHSSQLTYCGSASALALPVSKALYTVMRETLRSRAIWALDRPAAASL